LSAGDAGSVSAEKALTTILLTTLLFSTIPFTTAQEEFEWNRRIPFIGAQPTLVLMVQFSDVRMSISSAQAEQIVKVVDNFVRTASYGRTWLEYTIHPRVLTLPKPMAYYGGPSQGAQRGDDRARIIEYHLTTIRLAKQEGLDLSNYKHIIVIHAGKDEAFGGTANDIWSHCHCVFPEVLYFLIEQYGFDVVEAELRKNPQTQWAVELFMHRTRDGRGHLISGIETVAEYDDPGAMAHEFTHSMWISDHYVYRRDGYSGGSEVGVWTNMDYGDKLDPPVDIDGWSKYLLGWVEAVTVEQNGEYLIHTLDKPDEPHGLLIPINDKEYYFIHARRPVGNDVSLPGPGVLIFRVNKYKSGNVEGEPFMVQLYDANPNTPPECETYAAQMRNPKGFMTLCVKIDAPFYDRAGYRNSWNFKQVGGSLGTYSINLENQEFVTEEGYRISVVSFDQGSGVAKVRISLRGDNRGDSGTTTVTVTRTVTGTVTETLYTTTTVVGAETRTVVVTVTATRPPPDTGERYTSLAIILAALIIALFMVASVRRRAPPPPPPM
jgi:M6 family metalloprotease-like protein